MGGRCPRARLTAGRARAICSRTRGRRRVSVRLTPRSRSLYMQLQWFHFSSILHFLPLALEARALPQSCSEISCSLLSLKRESQGWVYIRSVRVPAMKLKDAQGRILLAFLCVDNIIIIYNDCTATAGWNDPAIWGNHSEESWKFLVPYGF